MTRNATVSHHTDAAGGASRAAKVSLDRVLLVRVGGHALAFEMRQVIGLGAIEGNLLPPPEDSPLVVGLLRFKRQEVVLIDLAGRLQVSQPRQALQALVVSVGGFWVGFHVDEVVELADSGGAVGWQIPGVVSELPPGVLRCFATVQGIGCWVVDTDRMLSEDDMISLGDLLL